METGHGDTEINKYWTPLGNIGLKIMIHDEIFPHIS